MVKISALPPAGTLADDDETPFTDDSAGATKKYTLANLLVWLQSKVAWITHGMVASGFCVQEVGTTYSSVATGSGASSVIPLDDTIPQNTEGVEFLTQTITPLSTSNILEIEVTLMLSNGNATQYLTAALFQDSTAGALHAVNTFQATAAGPVVLKLTYRMAAGTTSATTFKVRAGSHQNTTTTVNGQSGARLYGAIPKSSIIIREIKA